MIRTRNQEADRFFNDFERLFATLWTPAPTHEGIALDLFERDQALFIQAALPGMSSDDVQVTVDENVLTLAGETRASYESDEQAKVYRRELRYGKFTRSIRLPQGLDLNSIQAEFERGLLTVRIPKVEPNKPEPLRVPIQNRSNAQ